MNSFFRSTSHSRFLNYYSGGTSMQFTMFEDYDKENNPNSRNLNVTNEKVIVQRFRFTDEKKCQCIDIPCNNLGQSRGTLCFFACDVHFLQKEVSVPSASSTIHDETQTRLCCMCNQLQNGFKRGSSKYEHRPGPITCEIMAKFFNLPLSFIGKSGAQSLLAHKRCL